MFGTIRNAIKTSWTVYYSGSPHNTFRHPQWNSS